MAEYYQVPLEWLIQNGSDDDSLEYTFKSDIDNNIMQQLLNMFKRLSDYSKYKVLGYIERLCLEELDENKN